MYKKYSLVFVPICTMGTLGGYTTTESVLEQSYIHGLIDDFLADSLAELSEMFHSVFDSSLDGKRLFPFPPVFFNTWGQYNKFSKNSQWDFRNCFDYNLLNDLTLNLFYDKSQLITSTAFRDRSIVLKYSEFQQLLALSFSLLVIPVLVFE